MVAGCMRVVPPAPQPPPAPRPLPPPPAPAPAPVAADWRDWPLSAGTWSYQRNSAGSVARFGLPGAPPELSLRCSGGSMTLERKGANGPLTVRTTSLTRALPAASLASTDGLLDAMSYSRGRFVVETAGLPPLVVPAWSEVPRVVEDCRG